MSMNLKKISIHTAYLSCDASIAWHCRVKQKTFIWEENPFGQSTERDLVRTDAIAALDLDNLTSSQIENELKSIISQLSVEQKE